MVILNKNGVNLLTIERHIHCHFLWKNNNMKMVIQDSNVLSCYTSKHI